jgi:DNA polymerase-3 subunit beta
MNFKVNSKELENLLSKIYPAIPTKTPMPILEYFYFELSEGVLSVYGTDLEISLKASISVPAEGNFKGLIQAKRLYELVRSFRETTVYFQIEYDHTLYLSTDKGKYKLVYLDTDDYPDIPSFPSLDSEEEIKEVIINGDELKYSLEKTSFAISKEEIRPAMMGMLFEFEPEGLRFVATDGHRLINLLDKNVKHNFEEQYVIPERAISVLSKLLDEKDVKIYFDKTHVSFKLSDIELISRLIGYKYPEYKNVIPMENEFTLKVNREELNDTIKRMLLFSVTGTRKIKFSLMKNEMEISAEDIDTGASANESMECEFNGETMDIGLNAAFLSDVLNHLAPEEEVIFKINSPTKAIILLPMKGKENFDLLMLVMPVRLNA